MAWTPLALNNHTDTHSRSGFSFVIKRFKDITHNFCRFVQLTVQSFSHSLSSVFVYTLYIKSRIVNYKMSLWRFQSLNNPMPNFVQLFDTL